MFNASEQIYLLDIAEMLPLYIKEQTATGGLKTRDWKTQDQISRVENARPPSMER